MLHTNSPDLNERIEKNNITDNSFPGLQTSLPNQLNVLSPTEKPKPVVSQKIKEDVYSKKSQQPFNNRQGSRPPAPRGGSGSSGEEKVYSPANKNPVMNADKARIEELSRENENFRKQIVEKNNAIVERDNKIVALEHDLEELSYKIRQQNEENGLDDTYSSQMLRAYVMEAFDSGGMIMMDSIYIASKVIDILKKGDEIKIGQLGRKIFEIRFS